jgi:hypothetical protein
MSIIDDLLGQPNIVEALAPSSGVTGTLFSFAAPPIIRKRSGQFRLLACGNISWSTSGPAGATVQFVGSVGNVGPSVVITGSTAGGSSHFAITWVDVTGLSVGQPITYSLQVKSGGGSVTLPQGQASIVVDEG